MTHPRRPLASRALTALAALAWIALAWIVLFGDRHPGAGCAASVYRDPVTGRNAGIGDVRALGDGRVLCPRG